MVYYAYFVLAMCFIGVGIGLGKDNSTDFIGAVLQTAMLMPLIGRVLGWF